MHLGIARRRNSRRYTGIALRCGPRHSTSANLFNPDFAKTRLALQRGTVNPSTHTYPGVKRDSHGKIVRDPHAKEAFRKTHPCPSTGKTYGKCPGYVVDHIQALKHGGADDPSNMQWQTREAAKEKDKWK